MTVARFILLDRDGVINTYRKDVYVSTVADFEFIPGVLEAIRRLNESGYRLVVVSNQAGVGKGLLPAVRLEEVTRHMRGEIEAAGGQIEEVYYCVHAPEDGCPCRKPAPGMLLQAAARFGFRLSDSYFVGDNPSDAGASRAAGTRFVLALSGMTPVSALAGFSPAPDYVVRDLAHFAEELLADRIERLEYVSPKPDRA